MKKRNPSVTKQKESDQSQSEVTKQKDNVLDNKPVQHLLLITEKSVDDAEILVKHFKDARATLKNDGQDFDIHEYHITVSDDEAVVCKTLEPIKKVFGERYLWSPTSDMIGAGFIRMVTHIAGSYEREFLRDHSPVMD